MTGLIKSFYSQFLKKRVATQQTQRFISSNNSYIMKKIKLAFVIYFYKMEIAQMKYNDLIRDFFYDILNKIC